MRLDTHKEKNSAKCATIWLCVWIVLLVVQNPLEGLWGMFKYMDELCAVSLVGVVLWRRKQLGQFLKIGWVKGMLAALCVFFAAGIAGNLLYRYQPLRYVLMDILTNAKFYMVLFSGILVFFEEDIQENAVRKMAYALSAGLFALFVADRIFGIWQSDIRMGIPSAVLFYEHPTYLAGAMACLLSLLLIFYAPKNLPFIFMDLLVMACTMRVKAIGSAAVFAVLLVWVIWMGKKVKVWHIGIPAAAVFALGWKQIYFYYGAASNNARTVLTQTAFRILKDYFPIGTGFGTYASNAAVVHYSPVYEKYGFLTDYVNKISATTAWEFIKNDAGDFVYHLGDNLGYVYNEMGPKSRYLSDTFWPIILGQTGFLGTVAYVLVVGILFVQIWKIQARHRNLFAGGMFVMAYILISSSSEPVFNNALSIPLALLLGFCLAAGNREKNNQVKG